MLEDSLWHAIIHSIVPFIPYLFSDSQKIFIERETRTKFFHVLLKYLKKVIASQGLDTNFKGFS